jgi:hypothetical protein
MESNQFIQQGKQRSAILVSGKLFNNDDGLICPVPKAKEGQLSTPAGLCYDFLVVNQTTKPKEAEIMPHRQTWKTGQMVPRY